MMLVVDIGNTRIKWACVSERGLVDPGEAVHGRVPGAALESLAEAAPARLDRVVAVNVAGEVFVSTFTEFVQRRWNLDPEFVTTEHEGHGVRCAYADPSRMGSDRWVALIAGFRLAGGAACVIDAGTAVTLDVVDASGRHLGGLILAGPRVIATALDRQTSGIGETPRPISARPGERPARHQYGRGGGQGGDAGPCRSPGPGAVGRSRRIGRAAGGLPHRRRCREAFPMVGDALPVPSAPRARRARLHCWSTGPLSGTAGAAFRLG